MFIVQAVVLRHTIMAAVEAVEAIHKAVTHGNTEAVARMLDDDPRLLSSTNGGYPLFMRAAVKGRVGIVKLLLERVQDVNPTDITGHSALHSAALYGHEEVVSILLNSGAHVGRRNARGWTALMFASQGGKLAVVRLLLRSMGRCGLDNRSGLGYTALHLACSSGHADVVRALLLAGADHTIAKNNGRTPQQAAQNYGHPECTALIQVSLICSALLQVSAPSHLSKPSQKTVVAPCQALFMGVYVRRSTAYRL
jgi:ankyrin repeat protein